MNHTMMEGMKRPPGMESPEARAMRTGVDRAKMPRERGVKRQALTSEQAQKSSHPSPVPSMPTDRLNMRLMVSAGTDRNTVATSLYCPARSQAQATVKILQ